ncbi:Enolase-phosphatase E1 [Neolecta irregularis DAH-3]|uniref:Enolase-phosphatase E1 n=1 Tax=Neolecta irregularis (strain DAH-3) TaxID=1198029 RepID=A0A1U7LRD6_NEOID|nr:Enolase-phosphatase E1 [Neolecta irregularis DAH-3]|eukprot:OLL25112.1 Enolase-phosphatase E1 [Neolecta irregularis DAH-3]
MPGSKITTVLLDIEGTTTPLAFVRGTLFPYAIDTIKCINFSEPPYNKYLSLFQKCDSSLTARTVPKFIESLIKEDSKMPALKELQGQIWRLAYESRVIKAPVYADVVPLLECIDCYIYSSGSVSAQQSLFRYSDKGDLTRYIKGYFDPSMVGYKNERQSYENIAESVGVSPGTILFLSDISRGAMVSGIN